ncbi:MAG: TIGR02186 family protein, partial [Alphaproteobacteria bacterium]
MAAPGVTALAFATALLAAAPTVAAPKLVADLSSGEIAITTGFSGTELLLFGAIEGPGDVVVVVRGPTRRELVRRKMRVAGIWVNGKTVAFDGAPAYYRVAATAPLDGIAPPATLARLGIGAGRLQFSVAGMETAAVV